MRLGIGTNRFLVILTLMALPFLVGSECAFFFSSNTSGSSGDKDDKDKDDEKPAFVKTGSFGNPATAGINFESGTLAGITGSNGEFQYEEGKTVRFFVGDITLGMPVPGGPVISPLDLVEAGAGDSAAAINIARLLHSLDADPGDDVVTIPAAVRSAAVRSNASVSTAIEFLDFSDETAFVNAASQLVSVLTYDYPHTATLLDSDSLPGSKLKSLDSNRGP